MCRSILVAALASFGAGIAVGLAIPVVVAALSAVEEASREFPDAQFVSRFSADYGLSAEQQKQLRMIVQSREQQEIWIRGSINRKDIPLKQGEGLLTTNDRQANARIDAILTENQRQQYLKDSQKGSNR